MRTEKTGREATLILAQRASCVARTTRATARRPSSELIDP